MVDLELDVTVVARADLVVVPPVPEVLVTVEVTFDVRTLAVFVLVVVEVSVDVTTAGTSVLVVVVVVVLFTVRIEPLPTTVVTSVVVGLTDSACTVTTTVAGSPPSAVSAEFSVDVTVVGRVIVAVLVMVESPVAV